jgi:predicted house-cleaning noncanonical NTP pyrophosphatase (MazG superfamily)
MKYNKLVRDNIPTVLNDKGVKYITHIADDEEYLQKLNEKLIEEVNEFRESGELEELADILEVIEAICQQKNFDKQILNSIRESKAKQKGLLKNKIILDETIES